MTAKSGIRYPDVTVRLTGLDGNAFAIIGRVTRALKTARVSPVEVSKFMEEATAGDYDHLLQTVQKWVYVL